MGSTTSNLANTKMVLTENLSKSTSFPTSQYNEHIIMSEVETNQNANEGEGNSNTNDEIETSATSIDSKDQEESTLIQHKSSWDYIKEEEVNSIPNVTMNDCDKFWEDVRRSSQKIAIGVRAKAEEIDVKYKIQEKAR